MGSGPAKQSVPGWVAALVILASVAIAGGVYMKLTAEKPLITLHSKGPKGSGGRPAGPPPGGPPGGWQTVPGAIPNKPAAKPGAKPSSEKPVDKKPGDKPDN
jgi:hypothetical protein